MADELFPQRVSLTDLTEGDRVSFVYDTLFSKFNVHGTFKEQGVTPKLAIPYLVLDDVEIIHGRKAGEHKERHFFYLSGVCRQELFKMCPR